MSGGRLQGFAAARIALLAGLALAMTLASPVTAHAQPRQDTSRGGNNAGDDETQRRARTRLELASAYYAEGRLDTALEEIKRALASSPDLPQALNLRALIYSALGDDPQAEESYKRALGVASSDGDVLHNYGWFLCQRNRHAEADVMFQRTLALQQYRTPSRTLLVQGICEARSGRLELAEQTLKRAYEIDAANPATAMNLSDVLYRRGEHERARFYVRRVNNNAELRNAESLWLAARIENRLGNAQGVRDLGNQLRSSYPQSREASAFERGGFDE